VRGWALKTLGDCAGLASARGNKSQLFQEARQRLPDDPDCALPEPLAGRQWAIIIAAVVAAADGQLGVRFD
jgi:hypothetical protein